MAVAARSASVRQRHRGRAGFLLALFATAGQVLIAAPHETAQAAAAHLASRLTAGAPGVADSGPAPAPHDPAQCPVCQAAAQGRTALGAASCTRALLPSFPTSGIHWLARAYLPRRLADSKAEPRAPPA